MENWAIQKDFHILVEKKGKLEWFPVLTTTRKKKIIEIHIHWMKKFLFKHWFCNVVHRMVIWCISFNTIDPFGDITYTSFINQFMMVHATQSILLFLQMDIILLLEHIWYDFTVLTPVWVLCMWPMQLFLLFFYWKI